MNQENNVKNFQTLLKKTSKSLKEQIRRCPSGRIMISNETRGLICYHIKQNVGKETAIVGKETAMVGKETAIVAKETTLNEKETILNVKETRKVINKDTELIYNLAHKAFLEEKLKRINDTISYIERILKYHGTEIDLDDLAILDALPKNFKKLNQGWILAPEMINGKKTNKLKPVPVGNGVVKPVRLRLTLDDTMKPYLIDDESSISPLEWYTMPYNENNSYLEYKTITAHNGLKTRSKSEASILELYEMKGIYYHYDETVIIGNKLMSPDIIGIRRDGSFFIQEHAGLWSDEYVERNKVKIEQYEREGFVLGKNLIISFDDEIGNINLELISAMIDDIYER